MLLPQKVPKAAGEDSAALLRFLELLLQEAREQQETIKAIKAFVGMP